jgi:integrase
MAKTREKGKKGHGYLRERERADGVKAWQLQYVMDGRQFIRTVTAPNKSVAERALKDFIKEVDAGEIQRLEAEAAARAVMPTLGEWCDQFLADHMEIDTDSSTPATYGAAYRRLTPELRNTKLADLTKDNLSKWLRGLRDEKIQGRHVLSYNSVALYRAAVSSALNAAVNSDPPKIDKNPVPKLKDLKLGHKEASKDRVRRTHLERPAVGLLLSTITDAEVQLWTQIMGGSGLRAGEAGAIRWGDIDFNARVLHVRHSVKYSKARGHFLGTTKRKCLLEVPLGAPLLAALSAMRSQHQAMLRELAGLPEGVEPLRDLIDPGMCIFYQDISTPELRATPRPVARSRKTFKKAVKQAGLPAATVPHSMRHSAITAALAGADIAAVSAMAGHSRVSTTLDIYAHAVKANIERAAQLANDLIVPAPAATVETLPGTKQGS